MDNVSKAIGSSTLFENDRIRVWEMVLAPGEACPWHQHFADYIVIYMAPTHLELEFEGQNPRTQSYGDGFVQYIVVGEGGTPHRIRNVGREGHRQFIIELLAKSASEHEQEPETNRRWL
jgi:hypothetical protein